MLKSVGILILALGAIGLAFIFQQQNSDVVPGGVKNAPFLNLFPQSSESEPAGHLKPVPPGPSPAPENFPKPTEPSHPQAPKPPAAASPTPAGIPPSAQPSAISAKLAPPKLRISSGWANSDKISDEYIVLEHNDYENRLKIKISGLRMKNKNNVSIAIGKDNNENDIYLDYGERAVIATGVSPKGSNFQVNKCSGYFNQQASFFPSFSYSCPRLENLALPSSLNNRCIDYIRSLSSCTMPNINADTQINDYCAAFVSQHASYAGCVSDYAKDADFYQHEWRIFFGTTMELWDNRHDTIKLLDQSGNSIAELV